LKGLVIFPLKAFQRVFKRFLTPKHLKKHLKENGKKLKEREGN
jgi:hypothetical protein